MTTTNNVTNVDGEEIQDKDVFIGEDVKLKFATIVGVDIDRPQLAFTFGDVTIFLTSEQLDQMQAHRSDVTGESYFDIIEA